MQNYVLNITRMFCIIYKQSAGESNQQTVVQIHNTVFTYKFLITQDLIIVTVIGFSEFKRLLNKHCNINI